MQLAAGNLIMYYENGLLRWIMAGEDEVLRIIYFAVRDKKWDTIEGKIFNENIQQSENSFSISYEISFEQSDIKMHWFTIIKGFADNTIVFEIKGKALSTFQKNRLGFCVLHPSSCANKKILITHTDATKEENVFPFYISPHQPFKNIKAMQWQAGNDCDASLVFEGDIFETEDQRNWSDDSYKTYCTPITNPVTTTMHEAEEVHQKVTLKAIGSFSKGKKQHAINTGINKEKITALKIGIGRASVRNENYYKALQSLSHIGFSHYRVDIILIDNNWQQTLQECFEEAALLNTKLEIALFVFDDCTKELRAFIEIIIKRKDTLYIILLEENAPCISNKLLHETLPLLRAKLSNILIGAGTDNHFTDLNRSNLDALAIDFISYHVCPQVHAFDDETIIENAGAQAAAVLSAKHTFNKPVHISPVTLTMRRSGVSSIDKRQQTALCATFTLASLKALSESGAASVTYYETVGERGIISDDEKPFPVMKVFEEMLNNSK